MKRSAACSLTLLLASLLFSSGCIPRVAYTPNAKLIEQIGYRQAVVNFRALLSGARSPSAFDVEVLGWSFAYRYGGYGVYLGEAPGSRGSLQILFSEISRADLYVNAKVFLINAGGQRVGHEYLFESVEDGKYFCDLIASFKASGPQEEPPAEARQERPLSEAEQSPWAEEERRAAARTGSRR